MADTHPVGRPNLSLPIVPLPDEEMGLIIRNPTLPNLVLGSLALGTKECLRGPGVDSTGDYSIFIITVIFVLAQ